jgi:hypothetical protein
MRRQLRRAGSSGELPGSREACYFFPRDKPIVSARWILPPTSRPSADVLRQPDASPAAVLGITIATAQAQVA